MMSGRTLTIWSYNDLKEVKMQMPKRKTLLMITAPLTPLLVYLYYCHTADFITHWQATGRFRSTYLLLLGWIFTLRAIYCWIRLLRSKEE